MADGTETTPKKPYKDRPVGLPNTEASRKILSEYEDAPPAWTAFLPNTQASAKIREDAREEAMVSDMMARPDANAGTVTQLASGTTVAPSSTPQAQLTPPPPSAVGTQPVPFGSGEPALGSMTPLAGPAVAPSQSPQAQLSPPPVSSAGAQAVPYRGSGAEALLPSTPEASVVSPAATPTSVGTVSATPPRPQPAPPTVMEPPGLDRNQGTAAVMTGAEDARVNQGDGRTDIYRDEQGVQRRGGTAGYQGSIFEGPAIEQARQQPGLAIPQENNVTRVVTDANGRVVGYARGWASPEDARNASRLANPDGIQSPELSPVEQRDYDRAVAEAQQSYEARQAARGELPSQQPQTELQQRQATYARQMGFAPSDDPRDPYKNSPGRQLRDRQEAAERADVKRSIDISDWNQGRNPALNAISDAEVALAPGGFSSVGINPERRREIVDRGMRAELPDFLPSDMRDRQRARQEAFGPRLEGREREQAQLEGLAASPAFEAEFGPMNDRTDRRLSDRQLREAIELARRLGAQNT